MYANNIEYTRLSSTMSSALEVQEVFGFFRVNNIMIYLCHRIDAIYDLVLRHTSADLVKG